MKILVTGGSGYIGSHTCKALAEEGHDIVTYDNLSTGFRDLTRWGAFEYGDLCDYASLASCMRRHRPDGVIHFAARSCVGESVSKPDLYYHNNITGSLTLLRCMNDCDVPAIIFSSSCAVYGHPESQSITEHCPINPISPYGRNKRFIELMLEDFSQAYGLRWLSLRYFNAAGAAFSGEIGERHIPETHLIPRILMAADGSLPDFKVFGDSHSTPDGSCIRDYVHVEDLARAHVLAVKHCLSGGRNCSVNLGTGAGVSVFEIIQAAKTVLGKLIPYTVAPNRAGDPPCLVADAGLAMTLLGWEPRHSDMETILASAWQWHEKDRTFRKGLAFPCSDSRVACPTHEARV